MCSRKLEFWEGIRQYARVSHASVIYWKTAYGYRLHPWSRVCIYLYIYLQTLLVRLERIYDVSGLWQGTMDLRGNLCKVTIYNLVYEFTTKGIRNTSGLSQKTCFSVKNPVCSKCLKKCKVRERTITLALVCVINKRGARGSEYSSILLGVYW